MATLFTLPDLPAPAVIETLDYAAIKAALLADFAARYPDYSAFLESDPAVKLIEVAAYREMLLRYRINQAARANLLAFAGGTDLDHLASFYGVERLSGESDDALRLRVRARIVGWSTGGSAAAYRYYALSAHPGIADVGVSSPAPGTVAVALLPAALDPPVADAELVGAAQAAVTDDMVKVLTDTVVVAMATPVTVDVVASVWLHGDAADGRLAEIETALRAAVAAERRLGWDVTVSWVVAQIQRQGVYRVDVAQPLADIVIAPDGYAVLGDVALTLAGRAD
jgi:phage-related baseplate assembly protein